jgi:hypothetical protein
MNSEEFRRAREYAAWILLAAGAFQVFIGAWTLSGVPGGPGAGFVFNSGSVFGSATVAPFWLRGETSFPDLVAFTVTALPVAAVLLVALVGRPPAAAHWITQTAVIIQAVALALGLVAWAAVLGKTDRWLPVSWAVDIAVAVAGLILTNAVLRSLRAEPRTRPGVGARKR